MLGRLSWLPSVVLGLTLLRCGVMLGLSRLSSVVLGLSLRLWRGVRLVLSRLCVVLCLLWRSVRLVLGRLCVVLSLLCGVLL